jgi:hypothetical protein
VPLLVNITTSIPRPNCFRYDRAWALHPEYHDLVVNNWNSVERGDCASKILARLKMTRRLSKQWARRVGHHAQREQDSKAIIDAIDLLEEERPLHPPEARLRSLAIEALELAISEKNQVLVPT